MPQPLPVTADGTPIPWDKAASALAQGQAGYHAEDDVHVLDPATQEWRVAKGAKVGEYLRAGWQVASPAAVEQKTRDEQAAAERSRMNTPGQALKANLEGYASGLSGGLSNAAIRAVDPAWADEAAKRAKAHWLPHAAGEVYGLGSQVVGASLLSGGTAAPEEAALAAGRLGTLARALTAPGRALGAAGELGEAAAAGLGATRAGLAGRAALAAGRGVGEGALLGLGQEVSSAALDNRPLTAQKLLASGLYGGLIGGAAGGALQPIGEGVSALGRRALDAMTEGKPMAEALEGAAQKYQVKGIFGNNLKMQNELTNFGRNPDRAARVGQKLLDMGLSTDTRKAVTRIEDATERAGQRMEELAAEREALEAASHKLTAGATDAAWAEPMAGASVTIAGGMDSTAAREALELARDQIARIESVPLGSHKAIAGSIRAEIAPLEAAVASGEKIGFREMWGVRRELYKSINWARDSKAPQYREMRELAGNFDDALTMDMDAMGQAPGGTNLGAAWRAAKEDYHDLATARDAARETVKRLDKNRSFSLTDYILGAAMGVGGGPAGGLAMAYGNKLLRERGPAAMAKLLSRLAHVDMTISNASRALLETTPKLARAEGVSAASPFKDPVKSFAEQRQELLTQQKDEEHKAARMGETMAELDGHPDAQVDVGDLWERAHQYLLAELPAPMGRAANSLTPDLEAARVPRTEKLEWLEKVWSVNDPVGAIASDLAKGRVSRVKLAAVQAVYPDLYADWGNKMQLMIAEKAQQGKPLPYRRRVFLSMAFGFNGDVSLTPDFLDATQAAHAMLQQAAQASAAPGGKPGLGAPSQAAQSQLATNLATQTFKFH